jgi:hypothetical protein
VLHRKSARPLIEEGNTLCNRLATISGHQLIQ